MPLKQRYGGGMAHVERTGGAWNGDIDYHVALLKQLFTDALQSILSVCIREICVRFILFVGFVRFVFVLSTKYYMCCD